MPRSTHRKRSPRRDFVFDHYEVLMTCDMCGKLGYLETDVPPCIRGSLRCADPRWGPDSDCSVVDTNGLTTPCNGDMRYIGYKAIAVLKRQRQTVSV